jgi:YfiH family protein
VDARVVGRRAAVPPARERRASLLQHARTCARRCSRCSGAGLGFACTRARRRDRLTRPHAPGALRRCVRGTQANRDSRPEAILPITDDPAVAVSVRVADCVPILLADRRSGAVAAVHAGWRGTAAGAVMVAVDSLRARYWNERRDVIAAVGPSIGPCCYEVARTWRAIFLHPEAPTWFSRAEKPHLDLWRATRDQLARAACRRPDSRVRAVHIRSRCVFHSYRRDGKAAGRLVAAIRSAAGRTP